LKRIHLLIVIYYAGWLSVKEAEWCDHYI